jgi:hypothetical protein
MLVIAVRVAVVAGISRRTSCSATALRSAVGRTADTSLAAETTDHLLCGKNSIILLESPIVSYRAACDRVENLGAGNWLP